MLPRFCHFSALLLLTISASAETIKAVYRKASDVPASAGSYTATGRKVSFTLKYAPATGAELIVVKNTGLDFIHGTFDGLPHGQPVTLHYGGITYDFVANYYGGSGNDLVLTWAHNRVFAWGDNKHNQLTHPEIQHSSADPVPLKPGILAGKTLLELAVASDHSSGQTVVLCSDGTLATWGNEPAALPTKGSPLEGRTVVRLAASEQGNLALCSDGTLVSWGKYSVGHQTMTAVDLSGLAGKTIVDIATRSGENLALCSDGSLAAWSGYDESKQPRPAPRPLKTTATVLEGKKVARISSGMSHTLVLCSDNTLIAWGANGNDSHPVVVKVEGTPLAGKTITCISASNLYNLALCSDGTIAGWGHLHFGRRSDTPRNSDSKLPTLLNPEGSPVEDKTVVALSGYHIGGCMLLCSDGTLATWHEEFPEMKNAALDPGERFTKICGQHGFGYQALAVAAVPPLGPDGEPIAPLGPHRRIVKYPFFEIHTGQTVPDGATVSLKLNKEDYLLGENVLLDLVLRNEGRHSFLYEEGGDYRGAARATRYKVKVTDPDGKLMTDPFPGDNHMGGFVGAHVLRRGETFTHSIPLMRYVRIEKPGTYTIEATHDFGWKEDAYHKRPVGKTSITFRMPQPKEAEAVVAKMDQLPNQVIGEQGKRTPDFADHRTLQQSVSLEPLIRRAKAGDARALEGLGASQAVEATEALIVLANDADPKLSLNAATTLKCRLPDPVQFEVLKMQRGKSEPLSWDEKLTPSARALAVKLLSREETEAMVAGAFILRAIGTTEDAPSVLAAIDWVLAPMANPRRDIKGNVLDFGIPLRDLLGSIRALHERGYQLPESITGDAQRLLYFEFLVKAPGPRPDGWLEKLDTLGNGPLFPICEAALRSIPDPLPPECVKFVHRGLAHPDYGVCRTACDLAGKSGLKEFIPPLLKFIEIESEPWLFRSASSSAFTLGAYYEALVASTSRLNDETIFWDVVGNLSHVVEGLPGSSGSASGLKPEEKQAFQKTWQIFLAEHADELRTGKRYFYNDPTFPSVQLFGAVRSWHFPNNTNWPVLPEIPKR